MSDPRHVLLVEDNQDDVDLTLRAFRKHGFTTPIRVARDGQEALHHLLDPQAPLPSLVLLDLKLPLIGGLGVLKRMRSEERTRMVPVVILTSSREEADVADSYRSGANSYVRKPVDFADFTEAARQLGVYWLALNEPPPEP